MNSRSFRTLEVCLVALSIVVPCRLAAADAITLEWNPSTDQIAGYKLYVGTQSGTYSQNFDVATATLYTFNNAVAGQRYCFAVAAYSSSSIESPKSNEVCGFSNAPPWLTNPGTQSSAAGEPTSLQLTGSDPEGQALTYGATGLPPGLSLMASTGYISGSGITAGNYSVSVTASDGVLSSSQSFTWAMGSTTSPPPLSSVTVSAQAIDRSMRDQVRLAWTTASWTEVRVYRNDALITQTANDGNFTDNIRRAKGAYTYVVCASDAAICSNSVTVIF
jgi:fibronectin type 3 domain-containing protein